MSLIDASLQTTIECVKYWGRESPVNRDYHVERTTQSISRALRFLSQREFTPNRAVVAELHNGWTAYFDNQLYEFMPQAELFILCKRLKVTTCFFYYDHMVSSSNYGCGQIQINRHDQSNIVTTYLESGSDVGSSLHERGEDRFVIGGRAGISDPTPQVDGELINSFAEELGVSFNNIDFYTAKIANLHWSSGPHPRSSVVTNLFAGLMKRGQARSGGRSTE